MTITLLRDSVGQFLGRLRLRAGEGEAVNEAMSNSDEMLVLAVVFLVIGLLVLCVVGLVLLGVYRGACALLRAITGRPRPAAAAESAEPEDAAAPGSDADGGN
ncbi:hypothetical protein ACIQI8_01460 [Streptomyces sp. NPDC092369]|uniref:hypothetical protein n=1 Tax=Streptomyces sp. NPDC092369 TaxID=3366015 RepID=UPI00380EC027